MSILVNRSWKAKQLRGPHLWYGGYPALIEYSLLYDKRKIKGLAELDERINELNVQLDDCVNTLKAIDNFVDNVEYRAVKVTPNIHKVVFDSRLRLVSRRDSIIQSLEQVTAARNEWLIMQKTKEAEK